MIEWLISASRQIILFEEMLKQEEDSKGLQADAANSNMAKEFGNFAID